MARGKPEQLWLPVHPLLLLRLAALTLMLVVLTRTQADPDLWGHVLFGRDIVAARSVPRVDPYAFTSDRPWIDHEWLAEAMMYGAYRLARGAGLIVLKLVLVFAVVGLATWLLRRAALAPTPHDFIVFLTVAGVAPLAYHLRPELFSLVLFTVLLLLLARAARGRPIPILLVPLVMLLWVNLHGGWIVGVAALAVCCHRLGHPAFRFRTSSTTSKPAAAWNIS